MAIVERQLPGDRWERTYTGKDIEASKGELNEHGRKEFEKSYWKSKEHGFEKISDPNGNPTWVKANEVEEYRRRGYGKVFAPSMVVPDLPWKRGRKPNPGRRKYKWDAASKQMVEVA